MAHAYSFRAYVARHAGDLGKAMRLTDAAIRVPGVHPILPVYDRYQRAELFAAQGDRTATARAMRCADRAAADTDGVELPAYG
ncbi:hypothetical protein ACLMAL_37545 [Nocardia sp. CWNU-33]|uniref:hypothetical protein n=1 Tax=Nocardia sp. CWNU-33 TaxID=3392117 RepID=UPI00398E7147